MVIAGGPLYRLVVVASGAGVPSGVGVTWAVAVGVPRFWLELAVEEPRVKRAIGATLPIKIKAPIM
jgi:hypothetical protein